MLLPAAAVTGMSSAFVKLDRLDNGEKLDKPAADGLNPPKWLPLFIKACQRLGTIYGCWRDFRRNLPSRRIDVTTKSTPSFSKITF